MSRIKKPFPTAEAWLRYTLPSVAALTLAAPTTCRIPTGTQLLPGENSAPRHAWLSGPAPSALPFSVHIYPTQLPSLSL